MITIPEWHEIFKVIFIIFGLKLVAFGIFAKWLEFTYKKAHKKTRKIQKEKITTIV